MSKIRPVLQVGDVVRLSKRGLKKATRYITSETTMIVRSITGDGSDGRSKVKCNVIVKSGTKEHGCSSSFYRRDLWRTGYNVTAQKQTPHAVTFHRGGVSEEAVKAFSKEVNKVLGKPCSCDMQVLMSTGCRCGGK